MRFTSRSRPGLLLVLLLLFTTGLGLYTSMLGVAHATGPHIGLSPKVGPPTTNVQVNGTGFGHSETVLLDFDTTQVGAATTDATGKFVARLTVSKTALPGTHTVRATGQSSGLTAQALILVQTDWAQFHFGTYHTGHNPYENVLTPSNVSTLTLDWSYTAASQISSSPVVSGGVVYIGAAYPDNSLYALDAVTGALKWNYVTGNSILSSPAVAHGVVYIGSEDDKLYALDAVTGTLKWSYTTGGFIRSSPALAGGEVYIGSDDDKLYALDAVTGAFKWSYTTGSYVDSSPAVANGVVYVGSDDDTVYAFHLPGMS